MKQIIVEWQSDDVAALTELLEKLIEDGNKVVTVIPEVYNRSGIIQCASIIIEPLPITKI